MSANYGCTPFEIMKQDTDEVIMLINFYTRLAEEKGEESPARPAMSGKPRRIKVNDKTATGGWY